ncbi:hypothetical protein Tco_1201651 [Tanacetum coccineum]
MADVNVNVNAPTEQAPAMAPPTRTDDQILPRSRWVHILWGVVNRAHIDYAERMWEEFTQSIHSFFEDKKNLELHTQRKKKANPIVIPSIRFTKLIIHHLQSKHKFHPRPDSPLYLPYEEYVLGYLKFSAKVTKREVFGMPIPNDLITDDIRGEQYYNAYLEKVAKHQRYLAGEEVSDPDSPAHKLDKAIKHKATKKSKPSAPKVAPVTKPAVAKASKQVSTNLICTCQASKKRNEAGVPENEPRLDDEEAATQRAIEESLKEVHDAHRGPLPPVVIREPDSRKFQPLPEKEGPTEQYIFQRRTSTPTESSGHDESSSLYAELGLTVSEIESDEEVPGIVARVQDEGQAGPNPGETDEGQAVLNPGDVAASQPPSSHVFMLDLTLKHGS